MEMVEVTPVQRPAALQGGFTILEVLLALVVVTIGGVAAVALQAVSARAQYQTTQRYEAGHLAETLLSRVQSDATAWVVGAPDPATALVNAEALDLSVDDEDRWRYPALAAGSEDTDPVNQHGVARVAADTPDNDRVAREGRTFCPEYRLDPLTGVVGEASRTVRVRVYYPRVPAAEALFADCDGDEREVLRELAAMAPGDAAIGGFTFGQVGMVQVSGVIRASRPIAPGAGL